MAYAAALPHTSPCFAAPPLQTQPSLLITMSSHGSAAADATTAAASVAVSSSAAKRPAHPKSPQMCTDKLLLAFQPSLLQQSAKQLQNNCRFHQQCLQSA
jgi:hypothetical protein